MSDEIAALEMELYEKTLKLAKLRSESKDPGVEVQNYKFSTLTGEVSLLELFAGKQFLYLIHNMGQACRYCTLWADGINPFLPHLEDRCAVVLVALDRPAVPQGFANDRGWRFRMASHGGGAYISEQTVMPGSDNMPGVVVYRRDGNKIFKKRSAIFGPGDLYCSIWNLLGLAGVTEATWTPQYSYWRQPSKKQMEDGGKDLCCD